MKYLLSLLLLVLISFPSLSEIREFESDKVIINTETGKVVFVPRQIDYDYHYGSSTAEFDKKPSLKERIFGRKGCSKR